MKPGKWSGCGSTATTPPKLNKDFPGQKEQEAKKKYTLAEAFPYFKDKVIKIRDIDLHENNVEAIWERISK